MKTLISYKGFDKNFKCRGFQYEIGKEYEENKAKCCKTGFHACSAPLNVFDYYAPATSKYALVEQSGNIDQDGKKIASTKIKIKAELSLFDLIKAQVEWVKNQIKEESNTGDYSAVTNTGDQSAATNTGDYSVATNTGYRSAVTNTGDYSVATNTGDQSAATNTGYRSAVTNTGDYSVATNTGDRSVATNTGHQSAATNTGDRSVATNTGHQSAATNTGDQSAATNTGDQSAATNIGYRSAVTNTGDQSAATNIGYRSAATVEGQNSVAMACGIEARAKAKEGGCIVICDWRKDDNDDWYINGIYSAKVGGKIKRTIIEPDTFYWFENGRLRKERQ